MPIVFNFEKSPIKGCVVMKSNRKLHLKKLCSIALSLVLLCGYFAVPSYAETSQTANLTPDDKSYENGNIILH